MSKFSLSSFCEVFFFFCQPGCHLASNHPPRLSCWSPMRLSWRLSWEEGECIASLDSIEFPGRLSAQDYQLAILTEWWSSHAAEKHKTEIVQWVRNRNVVSFHSKNETGLLWLSRRKANSRTADNRQLSENCILYDETWNHSKSLSFFKCFLLWVVVELSALLERVRVYISAVQNSHRFGHWVLNCAAKGQSFAKRKYSNDVFRIFPFETSKCMHGLEVGF